MVYHHSKIWDITLGKLKAPMSIGHYGTTLFSQNYIPDPDLWLACGVVFLFQVFDSNGVRSFQDLKLTFNYA